MAQPVWEKVGMIGDKDYVTYGGTLIFRDTTGVYAPEAEIIVPPCDDDDAESWTIYRHCLDKCTYVDGVLSDNKFHPEHPAWFAKDLKSVAGFCGTDVKALREGLCSDDVMERAHAYQNLVNYFGPHEFDQYQISIDSEEKMLERYPE